MANLTRFSRYVLRHWLGAALVLLASVASALLALPVPLLVRAVIDRALPQADVSLLALLVGGICLGWLLSHGLMIAAAYGGAWLRETVHLTVRQELFDHLQAQPASFHEEEETGGLVSRLTSDASTAAGLWGERLFEAAGEVVYLVGGAAVLLRLDLELALVSLVTLPAAVALFGLLRGRLYDAQLRLQRAQQELSARLHESLAGVRVVQAYGLEARESARVRARGLELRRVSLRRQFLTSALTGLGILVTLIPVAAVVWGYGGYRVLSGALTIGTLVAFYHYLGTFFRPMSVLYRAAAETVAALAAAGRVFEILDRPTSISDPAEPQPLGRVEGRIDLKGVTVIYGDGRRALDRVDLTIQPGEVVGIVGPTGAGKTTLAHLLVRFGDPAEGRVRLDGLDLREVGLAELRSQVGLVVQEVFLWNDTVRENVRLSRPGASDEEVEEAARLVGADGVVADLPQGWDTVIGERGARLSGGQRQLLALARVMLHDPRVLVFDEATSAVDALTERRMHRALEAAVAGRTTLIIAHRASTLRLARRVVVLDRGRVVGDGCHAELLESVTLYRELYEAGGGPS